MPNYRVMTMEYRNGNALSEFPRVVDRADNAIELISRRDAHIGATLRENPHAVATYSAPYDEFKIDFGGGHAQYVKAVS